MLVLSRKCQESVVVGGEVGGECGFKVTVMEVKSGTVRLGFEVDPEVPVHRWEVWERICAETGQAERRSSPKQSEQPQKTRPSLAGAARRQDNLSQRKSNRSPNPAPEIQPAATAGGRSR